MAAHCRHEVVTRVWQIWQFKPHYVIYKITQKALVRFILRITPSKINTLLGRDRWERPECDMTVLLRIVIWTCCWWFCDVCRTSCDEAFCFFYCLCICSSYQPYVRINCIYYWFLAEIFCFWPLYSQLSHSSIGQAQF